MKKGQKNREKERKKEAGKERSTKPRNQEGVRDTEW